MVLNGWIRKDGSIYGKNMSYVDDVHFDFRLFLIGSDFWLYLGFDGFDRRFISYAFGCVGFDNRVCVDEGEREEDPVGGPSPYRGAFTCYA